MSKTKIFLVFIKNIIFTPIPPSVGSKKGYLKNFSIEFKLNENL